MAYTSILGTLERPHKTEPTAIYPSPTSSGGAGTGQATTTKTTVR